MKSSKYVWRNHYFSSGDDVVTPPGALHLTNRSSSFFSNVYSAIRLDWIQNTGSSHLCLQVSFNSFKVQVLSLKRFLIWGWHCFASVLGLVVSTWNPHKRLRQIGILYYVFTAIMFPFVFELFRSTAYREHKIIQQPGPPRQEVVGVLQEINIYLQRNLILKTMKSGILLMGNPRLKWQNPLWWSELSKLKKEPEILKTITNLVHRKQFKERKRQKRPSVLISWDHNHNCHHHHQVSVGLAVIISWDGFSSSSSS